MVVNSSFCSERCQLTLTWKNSHFFLHQTTTFTTTHRCISIFPVFDFLNKRYCSWFSSRVRTFRKIYSRQYGVGVWKCKNGEIVMRNLNKKNLLIQISVTQKNRPLRPEKTCSVRFGYVFFFCFRVTLSFNGDTRKTLKRTRVRGAIRTAVVRELLRNVAGGRVRPEPAPGRCLPTDTVRNYV